MAGQVTIHRWSCVIALVLTTTVHIQGVAVQKEPLALHALRKRSPRNGNATTVDATLSDGSVAAASLDSAGSISGNNSMMADISKGRSRRRRTDQQQSPVQESDANKDVTPKETAWLWDIHPPLWLLIAGPFVVVTIFSACCCYGWYFFVSSKRKQQEEYEITRG